MHPTDLQFSQGRTGRADIRWPARLTVWRSPADQPAWARPALLAIAVLAALAYAWDLGSSIEIYYAAAARSMSMHWHAFLFGAFDPAATISVDKLPGALWVQALSVHIFGPHTWAVALPQVVEGVLTVLVLYRAVRRLAGPMAGILASLLLALSPAAVALDRGNIPDTLLILLSVLAADSAVAAITAGRWRSAVMAGVWVGLAFQAKMVEAWLIWPSLAVAVLVASPLTLRTRLVRVAATAAVGVVVSLSWMAFVTLTPASQRPYVDGSHHNSVFEQVFQYNGLGRVGQSSPNQELARTLDIPALSAPQAGPAVNRLLVGSSGRDVGWLIPAALVVVAAVLIDRRRLPRIDPVRAAVLLWGVWLVTLAVVFSASTTINSYYLAALTPAIAGLIGIGGSLAWTGRESRRVRCLVAATAALTAGYAYFLLPAKGTGVPSWLGPVVLVLGVATLAALGWTLLRTRRAALAALFVLGTGAGVLVPLVASGSVVANRLGPFDTPFQPTSTTAFSKAFFGSPLDVGGVLPVLELAQRGAPDLMATQTSVLAAPFIFASGEEVLPIGGYTGTIPSPAVATLRSDVRSGTFHLVLSAQGSRDPRVVWVAGHCRALPPPAASASKAAIGPLAAFFCR